MIPVGDNVRLTRFPLVTRLLVALNVLVFVMQVGMPASRIESVYYRLGVVPIKVTAEWSDVRSDPSLLIEGFSDFFQIAVLPFVTCMFLHGGPIHLLGNMVFLWIFGDNVEDRMGGMRFLVFYLLCGFTASMVNVMLEPTMKVPVVGASGAIAGILSAYLVLFPRARILLLVPIFLLVTFVELPAYFFLVYWFLLQLPVVHRVLGFSGVETVAYWAHVGGFLAGLLLVLPFLVGTRRRRTDLYLTGRR